MARSDGITRFGSRKDRSKVSSPPSDRCQKPATAKPGQNCIGYPSEFLLIILPACINNGRAYGQRHLPLSWHA